MSKALQWVIGLGVVLMVIAVVFSSVAPYFLPQTMMSRVPLTSAPQRMFGSGMPFMPGLFFGAGQLGVRFPFVRLFGLTACVWPLLLVGLIVLGISLLTRRPAPPAVMIPPAPPAPAAPVSQTLCAQCGQPLQAGWRHCPSCGTPVAA